MEKCRKNKLHIKLDSLFEVLETPYNFIQIIPYFFLFFVCLSLFYFHFYFVYLFILFIISPFQFCLSFSFTYIATFEI